MLYNAVDKCQILKTHNSAQQVLHNEPSHLVLYWDVFISFNIYKYVFRKQASGYRRIIVIHWTNKKNWFDM